MGFIIVATSRRYGDMEPTFKLAVLVLTGAVSSAQAQWSFTDLGLVGGGATPLSMSSDGSVVIGASGFSTRAMIWTPQGGSRYWGLYNVYPMAVSGNGAYVVGYEVLDSFYPVAVRWGPGGERIQLTTTDDFPTARATGVSHDGSVVVGTAATGVGPRPFIWKECCGLQVIDYDRQFQTLSLLRLTSSGDRIFFNSYVTDAPEWRPVVWTEQSGFQFLEIPRGNAQLQQVQRVSPNGAVIAGYDWFVSWTRDFIWTVGGDVEYPRIGESGGGKSAISDDGRVMAGSYFSTGYGWRPYVWTRELGSIDLLGELSSRGILPADWTNFYVVSMNPSGDTLLVATNAGTRRGALLRVDFDAHLSCGLADIGRAGGRVGPDGDLDNNDLIVFIDLFLRADPRADLGGSSGAAPDGQFTNNDVILFIDRFFAGC